MVLLLKIFEKTIPFLKEDDIRAALLYAAKRIANEEVYEA
jgi:uncharacterized protein (DUF433 family)